MDKWKNYRYLFLLLVGGLICSLLTGFPLELIKKDHGQDESEVVETISMSADTVDEDGKLHSDGESDLIAGGSDNNMDNNTNDDMKNNATGSMNDDMQNNTTGSMNDDMQNEEPEVPLSFCEVSDDYFDDAVFIGDSRVVSLYEYSDWKEATYYCSSGMTLGGVFKDPTG